MFRQKIISAHQIEEPDPWLRGGHPWEIESAEYEQAVHFGDHLEHCLVVGEDLGTVPDEVRRAIDTHKMLLYRGLYFEKNWHHGTLKAPGHYPRYALSISGSHDLPTLRGFWQGTDLALRERLNLYPSDEFRDQQRQGRLHDRLEILVALAREQLIDGAATDTLDSSEEFNRELALSIQRYLARSQSMLLMVQVEDLLLQTNQVNLPGTIDEHPNWRGKLARISHQMDKPSLDP